jgi:hypothetical protein
MFVAVTQGPDKHQGQLMVNWDGSMFAHVDGLPDPPMPQAQHGRSASEAASTAFGARGAYQIAGLLMEDLFTRTLCLPVSERWREAVSTALLGNWMNPLFCGQLLKPHEVVSQLRAEAREFHRQAVPLWRRRSNGRRVLLLDTPMGENVSLYDLLASRTAVPEEAIGFVPADARLAALLRALHPTEREVVQAWADPGIGTWAEAALHAGVADPEVVGERVRRKVKRLISEQQRRHAQMVGRAGAQGDRS